MMLFISLIAALIYNIYIIVCIDIQAKQSLLILIILEASIYDEGVLSDGFISGGSLCPDRVMCGGGFVQGGFVPPSRSTPQASRPPTVHSTAI